jgi:hypothetical protein
MGLTLDDRCRRRRDARLRGQPDAQGAPLKRINVVAIHHQMTGTSPTVFFLHWSILDRPTLPADICDGCAAVNSRTRTSLARKIIALSCGTRPPRRWSCRGTSPGRGPEAIATRDTASPRVPIRSRRGSGESCSGLRGASGCRDSSRPMRRDLGDTASADHASAFRKPFPKYARSYFVGSFSLRTAIIRLTFTATSAASPRTYSNGFQSGARWRPSSLADHPTRRTRPIPLCWSWNRFRASCALVVLSGAVAIRCGVTCTGS